MLDSIPRAAEGVGNGCDKRSTFIGGDTKAAKSPQTVTEISTSLHHLHVLIPARSAEMRTLCSYYFNSQQDFRAITQFEIQAVNIRIKKSFEIVNGESGI